MGDITPTEVKNDLWTSASRVTSLFRKVERKKSELDLDSLISHIKDRITELDVLEKKLSKYDSVSEWFTDFNNAIIDLKSKFTSLVEDLNDAFSIFVVGKGKFGKSTLVNVLLQEEKAEIGIVPKTWKIDIFKRSSENVVKLKLRDGSLLIMSENEAVKFLSDEERKIKESLEIANSHFKKKGIKYKNDPKALRELKLHFQRELCYFSPVVEVIWPASKGPLMENFKIVDTPGLAQNLLADDVRSSLLDYYNKADGVIWILNANVIDEKASLEALKDLGYDVLGKNIICVINRIDLIRKVQGEDGVSRVIEKAMALYGDAFQSIIPMSALQALEGIRRSDEELMRESGMPALLTAINDLFLKKGEQLRYTSRKAASAIYSKELMNICKSQLDELNEKAEILRSLSEAISKDCRELQKSITLDVSNELLRYSTEVRQRISDHALILRIVKLEDDGKAAEAADLIKHVVMREREIRKILERLDSRSIGRIIKLADHWKKKTVFSRYNYLEIEDVVGERTVACAGDFGDFDEVFSKTPRFADGMDKFADSLLSEEFSLKTIAGVAVKGLRLAISALTRGMRAEDYKKNLMSDLDALTAKATKSLNSASSLKIDYVRKQLVQMMKGSFMNTYIESKRVWQFSKLIQDAEAKVAKVRVKEWQVEELMEICVIK